MPRICLAIAASILLSFSAHAVELEVTITVTALNKKGFVEFKAESDEKGEKATGHLKRVGKTRVFQWSMGSAKQNIWFWWDTLDGSADLKIVLTGSPGIPVTLLEAPCNHKGKGEAQVGKTLAIPISELNPGKHHYRRNPGIAPRLSENVKGANTHIKESDKFIEFKPSKAYDYEWDVVGE